MKTIFKLHLVVLQSVRQNIMNKGNVGTAKKLKPDNAEATEYSLGPVGLVWDHLNWSCAYDPCSITLLYYI